MKRILFAFLAIVLARASVARADEGFALHDGDRVLFFGDSITEQRHWTSAVENYVVTRFPNLNVRFIEAGWAGDTAGGYIAGGIDVRLKRDVLPHKPTVVVAMFGMNDGYYYHYDDKIEKLFFDNLLAMVKELRAALPEARIVLLQTPPFDNVTRPSEDEWEKAIDGGYNSVLIRYGKQVSRLAEQVHLLAADPNAALVDVLNRAKTIDVKGAAKIIPDRIHPGPAGGLIIAEQLLKALNAPAVVTTVRIRADHQVEAENTEITDLKFADHISWTQTDRALPFPMDEKNPVTALVLKASDFSVTLDRQTLQVDGLTGAKYELRIDGEKVMVRSGREWADGIDLAQLPTPMRKQAAKVAELTMQRSELAMARWRQVEVPFAEKSPKEAEAAVTAMNRLEDVAIAQQHESAQPKSRKYELIPLP